VICQTGLLVHAPARGGQPICNSITNLRWVADARQQSSRRSPALEVKHDNQITTFRPIVDPAPMISNVNIETEGSSIAIDSRSSLAQIRDDSHSTSPNVNDDRGFSTSHRCAS